MEKEISREYYIMGVRFASLEEYLRIRKMDPQWSKSTFLNLFHDCPIGNRTSRAEAEKAWHTWDAFSFSEAFKRYSVNASQLEIITRICGPAFLLENLEARVLDRETVIKERIRWFSRNNVMKAIQDGEACSALRPQVVRYEDSYTLYAVDGNLIGADEELRMVQCVCPSTGYTHVIFVDPTHPQCSTAIGAIAWTLREPDGECLTREEYLKITSET